MSDRRSLETSEPPAKRKKVRKGTHSCWECRRRKIKCQFDAADHVICIGCKQRGTLCRSQEHDDDKALGPGQKSDPPLVRRLDRLERMMERLVEKIVPDDDDSAPIPSSSREPGSRNPLHSRTTSSPGGPIPRGRESSMDILEATTGEGPVAALLAMRCGSFPQRGPSESQSQSGPTSTPALTSIESATPTLPTTATTQGPASRPQTSVGRELPTPKHFWVCTALRSIIPPQPALEAIVAASPGAPCVAAICYSEAERLEGKLEPTSNLAIIPPVSSHPLMLAKRALQTILCIQKLPPNFDWDALGTGFSVDETLSRLGNCATLVTSNDELVVFVEGVECLLFQGYYQANSGCLRKAWISIRRALSLAQMIGIHMGRSAAFRSCDQYPKSANSSSADVLWYRVVSLDSYLSLILGLPTGSQGDDSASRKGLEREMPVERLGKAHTAISRRILERNYQLRTQKDQTIQHSTASSYAFTQEIDLDLEAAAKSMPPGWCDNPQPDPLASQDALREVTATIVCQTHHFTLLILLHAPCMLREASSPRFDYSKTTCMSSAREILTRFTSLLNLNVSAYSCRRVSFAALFAAMTLCLAYVVRRKGETWEWERVKEDREMVGATRRGLEQIAGLKGDRLCGEMVASIEQLMPIIDHAANANLGLDSGRELHFGVPSLGSITIKLFGSESSTSTQHHRQPLATGPLGPAPPSTYEPSPQFERPIQFTPYDDQQPLGGPGAYLAESGPDLASGGDDRILQGVDAMYWRLFLDGVK